MVGHPREHYVELLYRALTSKHGVALRVVEGSVAVALSHFYLVRKKLLDPELEALTFARVSDPKEIWVIRRERRERE